MKRHLRSMSEILFDLFANEGMRDPQEEENLWAVREGMRRLDPVGYLWRDVTARKDHECTRGHTIQAGQTYYVYNNGGYGNDLKLCAGCMSMTLYFAKVDELPPAMFTHWDYDQKKPVEEKE